MSEKKDARTVINELLAQQYANAFKAKEEGRPVGFIRGNYGVIGEDGTLKETIPQAYLGSTIPEVFGNIGLNLRYKNWSLFANANYQTGGYAANWDAQFRYNYGASDDFVPKEEIDKNWKEIKRIFQNL